MGSEKENIATMETKNPSLNVRNSQDIEEVKENTTKADLSDAWMIDDVGTINSESEEENEGSAETNNIYTNEKEIVKEKTTDLSEAWMIDDVGTMESESEEDDDHESPKSKKITDKENIYENKQKVKEYTKSDLSEAWMIDDLGTIDSDSEGENESNVFLDNVNVAEKTNKDKAQTTKDISDAWMIDDVGKIDSESKKENEALPAGKKERVNTEKVN